MVESTAITTDAPGAVTGPLRVSAYLEAGSQLETTRLDIENALAALRLIQPIPDPHYEPIQEQNWMEAWKQRYQPILVGERLRIQPAWLEHEEEDRLIIRIAPGMAFGTGVHPTTQLSLQLLERHVHPNMSMIDVGCGSGILSIAASKLGAETVIGLDIDPQAIENATHNARLNNCAPHFALGSVSDLRAGAFPLSEAHLVVANILAPILIRLLDEGLAHLLSPDGVLILSGVMFEQRTDLLSALAQQGLEVISEIQMGDWLAFAAKLKP